MVAGERDVIVVESYIHTAVEIRLQISPSERTHSQAVPFFLKMLGTTESVQNQASADSLPCLLCQSIQNDGGDGIVTEGVVLHEDKIRRISYAPLQLVIEYACVLDNLYLIALYLGRTARLV